MYGGCGVRGNADKVPGPKGRSVNGVVDDGDDDDKDNDKDRQH